MKLRFLLPVLLITAVAAHAQITINASDLTSLTTSGATFTVDSGIVGAALPIGSASSTAQTFDFSGVTFKATSVTGSVASAASTPYKDSFLLAQFAVVLTLTPITSYSYEGLSATELTSYGTATTFGGPASITRSTPPEPNMKFPFTMGTTWTYTSDTVLQGGFAKHVTSSSHTVDAFGTIKLPGGETQPCLREKVKKSSTTIISTPPLPPQITSTTSLTFNYYLQSSLQHMAVDVDTTSENSSSATPRSYSYQHLGSGTGVRDESLPVGLALVQNFPNPFHDRTMVEYTLTDRAAVSIDVVDMLGRVISTVYSGAQDAGHFGVAVNANTLPAGQYDCRITVNGKVMNHPMNVVK